MLAACAAGEGTLSGDRTGDPAVTPPEPAVTPATAPVATCVVGEGLCTAWNARTFCRATESGGTELANETCPNGQGCVRGACVASACSDECTLGKSEGGKSCAKWDMTAMAGSWVDTEATDKLHDRAREYLRWLHRDMLVFGGVGDIHFADPPTNSQLTNADVGDSALWTGTYLATEALRLLATGSPDARAHVKSLVDTLHLWMNISPSPGVLVRHVRPAGVLVPNTGIDCSKATHHCGVTYEGKQYDYNGHVSRDQYQGVMLGYSLAYEALGSTEEATRKLIRDDVLELVGELMKERQVDAQITYKGTTYPKFKVTTRFMVVVNEELDDGAITLQYDGDIGGWRGFQEFIPDLASMFKQIPVLGLVSPASIPRDGSAIMLSSFFRVALQVTEGVSALAAKRQEIESFYYGNTASGGNVNDWLKIAQKWEVGGGECGGTYYSNNISMQPMYNWARLETTPSIAEPVSAIVAEKMWTGFLDHKNSYFSYLAAANMKNADSTALAAARDQVAQFPLPPMTQRAVDLRDDPRFTERREGCPDQAAVALDIRDRVWEGFVWQREPWTLFDGGDVTRILSGTDYLAAFYLGLRHGFIPDDAPGTCLRWK